MTFARARRSLWVGLGVAAMARPAWADRPPPPALRTSVVCEAPPAPGRFRCDVEVRVGAERIAWAEVAVVRTDDLILPLRARMGPRDATTHDADIERWSLGFVARDRGAGDVTLRVRAVVCRAEACEPVETQVVGHVVVGAPSR